MNLSEAIQWVESELMLDPALRELETGEVRRRLVLEHDIIARELRIPTKLVVVEAPTGSFPLPNNTRDTGLLAAHERDSGRSVPIYDLSEVAHKHPRWRDSHFKRKLLVWDASNVTAPVIPTGFSREDALLLTVVMKPDPLEDDSTEFWSGVFSEFHDLIPRRVAGDLLVRGATEQSARAGGIMLQQTQVDLRRAFARTAHPVFFAQGPEEVHYQ